MELNVPPDLQTKLARAADRRGVAAEALALEAIERAVEYDDWFLREVEKGLAQIQRGEVLICGARRRDHRPSVLTSQKSQVLSHIGSDSPGFSWTIDGPYRRRPSQKRTRSERRRAIRTTPGGLPEKLTPFPPAGQGTALQCGGNFAHGITSIPTMASICSFHAGCSSPKTMQLEQIDPHHGVLRRQPFSPTRYGCGARLILVTMRKRV